MCEIFFFFQAEDGIRDYKVTGVQTCALPISVDVHMTDLQSGRAQLQDFAGVVACGGFSYGDTLGAGIGWARSITDRKSTRLKSSHLVISYAVFCLKKKKKVNTILSACLITTIH